jgi:hypothetical protein
MQWSQEVFGPFDHHTECVRTKLADHPVVPDTNHNQDVLDSHLLEQVEQLLASAFLSAIVEAFSQDLLAPLTLIFEFFVLLGFDLTLLELVDSVSQDLELGLFNPVFPAEILEDQVDMLWVWNGSTECLVGHFLVELLFAETDWEKHGLHLFNLFLGNLSVGEHLVDVLRNEFPLLLDLHKLELLLVLGLQG